jgi:hypothetical protein
MSQICSFSWLFGLFWIPWISIWIFKNSACQFQERIQLGFWQIILNLQINLGYTGILFTLLQPMSWHSFLFIYLCFLSMFYTFQDNSCIFSFFFNKKDIAFLLLWDNLERFLALLPCICVLQPTLVHLYTFWSPSHSGLWQFKITLFAPLQWALQLH